MEAKTIFSRYGWAFWKLVGINLLCVLFSLPLLSAPAARAATVCLCRKVSEGEPIWVWQDFYSQWKANFRQATLFGIPCSLLLFALYYFANFYAANLEMSWLLLFPLAVSLTGMGLVVIMGWYVYLMLVSVELPLGAILKNAWKFALGRFRKNLILLLCSGLLYAGCFLLFPLSLPVILLLLFSTTQYFLAALLWPDVRAMVVAKEAPSVIE